MWKIVKKYITYVVCPKGFKTELNDYLNDQKMSEHELNVKEKYYFEDHTSESHFCWWK